MSRRRRIPPALGAALASAALLGNMDADAQLTVASVTVNRAAPPGGTDPRSQDVDWISASDCAVDAGYQLTIDGAMGSMAVYAATSSALPTGGTCTGAGCWEICAACSSNTVTFGAAELVSNVLGVDCNGMPLPGSSSSALTASGPVPLFFSLVDSSGNTGTWTGLDVELIPPAAPAGVSISPSDGALVLVLPSSPDPSIVGYYVFCVPDPTQGGGASASGSAGADGGQDAGTGTDSGSDAGTGTGGGGGAGGSGGAPTDSCPAGTAFPVDPLQPSIDSPYVCAEVLVPVTKTNVGALSDGGLFADGQRYVVAVAAYDDVGNLGPLSPLMCGTPQPTNTFLKKYCADDGAGCAGCSLGAAGAGVDPVWPMLGAAALGGIGIAVRRARRASGRGGRRRC